MDRHSPRDNETQSHEVSGASKESPSQVRGELHNAAYEGAIKNLKWRPQNDPANKVLSTLSFIDKSAIVAKEGGAALKDSVVDSIVGVHNIHLGKDVDLPVPKALETVAAGAAIGFASRTLLPQLGVFGKLGNAALAVALTAPVAKQAFDAANEFKHARMENDLRHASHEMGAVVGSLAASTPLGIAGFRAGTLAADRVLVLPSMAEFNSSKAQKFDAVNDWMRERINDGAAHAKNFAVGESRYPGSHGVAEQFPQITDSLRNGIKGTDYALPTVKLSENIGKDARVLVVTGHGVEAPEFTEVVKAMKGAGAEVTVATPDWTWDYQPKNPGKVTLAQWLANDHVLQGDISVSNAAKMMSEGKFDAMYIPGGAGNTAAIRTDSAIQALVRQSLQQKLDTWTICHGGQVFVSALEKNSGIKLTGSGDITAQDLPNAGFVVPKDPVVFDSTHKILSGKDPSVLNEFITAIGDRFKSIQERKLSPVAAAPKPFSTPVELLAQSIAERPPVPSASELRYPGAAPSYPRGLRAESSAVSGYPEGLDSWKRTGPRDTAVDTSAAKIPQGDTRYPQNNPNYPKELGGPGAAAEVPVPAVSGYPEGLDSWKRTGPRDTSVDTSAAKIPPGDTRYPQNNPNYPKELGGPRK